MKYLLKQNKEDKGVLCDKVTIEGFEYYISNDKPLNGEPYYVDNSLGERIETAETKPSGIIKRVICSNNPNIDIPQVIDEVERLAEDVFGTEMESYRGGNPFDQQKDRKIGFIRGYNKSQERYSFSEDDVVEFAKWSNRKEHKSKKDLLQLWKSQQPKIVYYNE